MIEAATAPQKCTCSPRPGDNECPWVVHCYDMWLAAQRIEGGWNCGECGTTRNHGDNCDSCGQLWEFS